MNKLITILLLLGCCFCYGDRRRAQYSQKAAAGGGGPTLVASDNFDAYSDSSNLGDATDWVEEGAASISVRKPASDGAIQPGNGAVSIVRHTATFAADQRAEVTIDAAGAGGSFAFIGPAVRVQSGAATGYMVVFSSGDLYLLSVVAGTASTVISDTGMTLSAGNRVAIEASGSGTGTRLKVQIDTGSGWTDKWTNQNPSDDIDGGAAGVGSWLLGDINNRADDWFGYDL